MGIIYICTFVYFSYALLIINYWRTNSMVLSFLLPHTAAYEPSAMHQLSSQTVANLKMGFSRIFFYKLAIKS